MPEFCTQFYTSGRTEKGTSPILKGFTLVQRRGMGVGEEGHTVWEGTVESIGRRTSSWGLAVGDGLESSHIHKKLRLLKC